MHGLPNALLPYVPILLGGGFGGWLLIVLGKWLTKHARLWWHAARKPMILVSAIKEAEAQLLEGRQRLAEAQESATYWEGAHREINARYDDLDDRFRRLQERAMELERSADEARAEIKGLRVETAERTKMLGVLAADRQNMVDYAHRIKEAFSTLLATVEIEPERRGRYEALIESEPQLLFQGSLYPPIMKRNGDAATPQGAKG